MVQKIIKRIENISGEYSGYEIFSDWIKASAIGISNSVDLIRNFLNLGIIESRNYIRISYGSFLYAGTNGISPFS